jgi:PAS domain S-box-containing protein
MSTSNPLLGPKPPAVLTYGVAVLSVAVALVLAQWPVFHLHAAPVSLFLCAAMFSAWFGGVGPGLLATVLSTLSFYYYFLSPANSLGAKPAEIPRLVVFVVSIVFVASLSAAQRSATESLRRARDDLTETVQKLERTNQALQAESTERQHAEKQLRHSEAYLAEAQRLSHTGSWAWTPATGEITYWSEECYRLLGFDSHAEQPQFDTFFERIHPDDQARMTNALAKVTREKSEFELDYRIVRPGGEIRDVHVVGHPVLSASGDLVEFVGTIIDVTDRKIAEKERDRLRQVQEELAHINRVSTMGELTATLAHEVNQPIAAALTDANTCIRWLNRDQPDLEEAHQAASRMAKDATRAAEIVSRIRSLFKKGVQQRELVDVNELVREMMVMLRGEAARYSIALRTNLAADLPQVMGDRVQLQQVLMNLIMNSIDAMNDAEGIRELTVTSQHNDGDELLVSVSDTGVGLPSENAEQIFNAFFTTKPHGTGMGLRISRSIIESHGGRLWAGANSPRGAIIRLTLPTKAEVHE